MFADFVEVIIVSFAPTSTQIVFPLTSAILACTSTPFMRCASLSMEYLSLAFKLRLPTVIKNPALTPFHYSYAHTVKALTPIFTLLISRVVLKVLDPLNSLQD